ncbi:hypothetical protein B0H19DRAFT_1365121 [Mycena capillaripes]|nr:hypothetical protein B0H19DRAFT_1365121 [Mycena capillaripes]
MARTPRAATTTAKAKGAAAIAAAESKEDAAKPKRAGRPRKKREPTPEPTPESESEQDTGQEDVEIVEDIDWKDEDGILLTGKLIQTIEERPLIRASLFPPVGAPKITGGKPKSDYQYELAKKLFEKHPTYKDAFAKAVTAKGKKFWYTKIKNRLETLIKKTKLHIEEMGQTGAGIETEADIMPGSSLTTKWDLIKADFPWFFRMRSLIGERPNLVPTGLGNNDSEYDVSLLLGSERDGDSSSVAFDDTGDLPEQMPSPSAAATPIVLDDDDSDSEPPQVPTLASVKGKAKRKRSLDLAVVDAKPEKRTKPTPGISQPAPKKTPAPKTGTAKDKFAAAVAAEEETARESLKVKQSKLEGKKEVQLERLRLQAELKVEKERGKLELARLKMKQDHEMRMEKMRAGHGQSHAGPSSHRSLYVSDSHSPFDFPILPTPSSDSGGSAAESYNFDLSAPGDNFDLALYGSGGSHM